jgi:2-polyprenyl-3-methyl-5-hydroxy-6-metoxy-1,4-benzoquinol methylase
MTEAAENPVFENALAYQKTAALIAAQKLDIFTAIGSGMMSADSLAARVSASPRGVRILCDMLTTINLLKKQDGRYALTHSSSMFLDAASPSAVGDMVDFVAAPEMLQLLLEDPAAYVRQGGSKGLGTIAPDNPIWIRFARAMAPLAAVTARRVAAFIADLPDWPVTVLDIAAGHGLYGIELARILPDVLVTAVDWDAVLTIAEGNAVRAGVSERYRRLPGDALTIDWGRDFDLILLPNFLHHFDVETCTALLRKVKASLSFGGIALAVDFIPNEDRISPVIPAMFAFWMLASTPAGDAYTASELRAMAKDAGLTATTLLPLSPSPESLIVFET